MHSVALKKLNTGKALLIALIILCIGLSFLDCKQGVGVYMEGPPNGGLVSVTYKHNHFSLFAVLLAGLQIYLLLKDRFREQLVPGVLSAAYMISLPKLVEMQNLLNDSIVYVAAPTGESAVNNWEVTPAGYIYAAVGWLLLAMTVFSAWWLKKQKVILDAENRRLQEEAEVVQ